jgi:Gas vesicle synthesis protein GvpL/GvpF
MTATATYLLALIRPHPVPQLVDICGIGDAPLRAITEGGLAAVACDVPLSEFGERPLQENLESLQWLEKTARAHDLAVRLLAQQVTTAPLRLATIYRDDESVRDLLRGIAGVASEVLTRLDGRDEWGVKLYGLADCADDERHNDGSGANYLRRRRAALVSRQDAAEQAAQTAADVLAALSELSADARAHRLQDSQLSGVAAPMLLNGAFLVDRSGVEQFSQLVKELAEKHPQLSFTLTGPWPPYSFAAWDDEL